jgi:hypothetical protein
MSSVVSLPKMIFAWVIPDAVKTTSHFSSLIMVISHNVVFVTPYLVAKLI